MGKHYNILYRKYKNVVFVVNVDNPAHQDFKMHHIRKYTILSQFIPHFTCKYVLIGSFAVGYSNTRHAIFDLLTVPPVLEQKVPKE